MAQRYCKNCKRYVGTKFTYGQIKLLVLLYSLFIIPGVLYSVFHQKKCPICGSKTEMPDTYSNAADEVTTPAHPSKPKRLINTIEDWKYFDNGDLKIFIDNKTVTIKGIAKPFIDNVWSKMSEKEQTEHYRKMWAKK